MALRTHFSPFGFPDDAEIAICGTWLGWGSKLSADWDQVDCVKCKRQRQAWHYYGAQQSPTPPQENDR